MKSYQILTLIGGILGLLISFTMLFTIGFLQFGFNLESDSDTNYLYVALSLSIVLYIICITIAFTLKKTRIVGIILIICSVIILISTSLYGVIGFALLLPAGIIALREKKVNEEVSKI